MTAYEQETTTIGDINCGDSCNIEFTLVIPDHDRRRDSYEQLKWELKHGGYQDDNCTPSFTDVQGKLKYGPFSGDDCKESLRENGDFLEYVFKIEVRASGGATFLYDHDYTITCTYNKENVGLQASFLPQHSVTETGTGK